MGRKQLSRWSMTAVVHRLWALSAADEQTYWNKLCGAIRQAFKAGAAAERRRTDAGERPVNWYAPPMPGDDRSLYGGAPAGKRKGPR